MLMVETASEVKRYSQQWGFNYITGGEGFTGTDIYADNETTFVWERTDLSSTNEITERVKELLNSTALAI